MQGTQCGTRSRDPRITPWAQGGAKPLGHPGCPPAFPLKSQIRVTASHRGRTTMCCKVSLLPAAVPHVRGTLIADFERLSFARLYDTV